MTWQIFTLAVYLGLVTIDLLFLIQISIGFGVGLILLSQLITGLYGFWRLRKMDRTLLFYVDAQTRQKAPVIWEVWEELLMLIGAYFLITPGFLTDLVGGLLLYEPSRSLFMELFRFIKKHG